MGLDLALLLDRSGVGSHPTARRQAASAAALSLPRRRFSQGRLRGMSSAGRRLSLPSLAGWRRPAVFSVTGPVARTARSGDGPSMRSALVALERVTSAVRAGQELPAPFGAAYPVARRTP